MIASEVFDAGRVMSGLTGFQRNTVEHVIGRLYGPDRATRFLVADETGLGKTMVARGVIARAIEELEHDRTVARIDIVYVCSNSDIAQQNLNALDVTGDDHHRFTSRLTLLAKHSRHLTPLRARFTKPVNLISFTPGTSFDKGWQSGKAEERAMLYLLFEGPLELRGRRATAAGRLLQGTVRRLDSFRNVIEGLRLELRGDIDENVRGRFLAAAEREGLTDEFGALIGELGQRRIVPEDLRRTTWRLVAKMRTTLARESVHLLEPDLIILDEFQRFRQLLSRESEAGELAHSLFDYPQARVLLLSATPYKPFTYTEEDVRGEDHHRNFMETIRFLAEPLRDPVPERIAQGLRRYREAIVSGVGVTDVADQVRRALLSVMTRTERPKSVGDTMGVEIASLTEDLQTSDLLDFVGLGELARHVNGIVTVEYWKSAPYFINFMEGYKIADQVRVALKDQVMAGTVARLMRHTQRIDPDALRGYRPIDMGNARLRRLAADTVEAGWWQLLWIPPSLPYLAPGGPYAEPFAQKVTKRLVFSSWTATPTAIATLLSYAADRLTVEGSRLTERTTESRKAVSSRLAYRVPNGRPQNMTSLALFWPMPGLAQLADPRVHCRASAGPIDPKRLQQDVAEHLRSFVHRTGADRESSSEAPPWVVALGHPGSIPTALGVEQMITALAGNLEPDDDGDTDDPRNLAVHVDAALDAGRRLADETFAPDVPDVVAELAAHSPGNIAYRALCRISAGCPEVTEAGLWQAAATLASGIRSLFARPETAVLLDKLLPPELPYWHAILRYCAWGNLQAVMDEYMHHLLEAQRLTVLDDNALIALANRAVGAVSIKSARYEAFNPDNPAEPLRLTARFALRYGGRRQEQESVRQPQVRAAFNSPFWPLVLATTSVGQEGIDFHWWCHAVMHWNTPTNPVDFEQREGRVDRYDGHAVRRNIAARHGRAILASDVDDPWVTAYALAHDECERLGEFAPHWVYPGPARIERHVAPYALSVDEARLARIKRDVALYRLTFGQPRQEDMLELLEQRYADSDPVLLARLRLDLRAPGPPEAARSTG